MSVRAQSKTLTLDDGHEIQYTTIGDINNSRPILLFIVGSVGLGGFYRRLACQLTSHFTCIYFDRRGFISSNSSGKQNSNITTAASVQPTPFSVIDQQVNDTTKFLRAINPQRRHSIYIFGTSFGATIALQLLLSHSSIIHTAVLHEPIIPTIISDSLPERKRIMSSFREMQSAPQPFQVFVKGLLTGTKDDAIQDSGEESMSKSKGDDFWSRGPPGNLQQAMREALASNEYYPDVTAIEAVEEKIIVMGGVESKDTPMFRMVEALEILLSRKDRRIWDMPGAHFSFADASLAKDSALSILQALRGTGRLLLREGMQVKTKM